MVKPAIQSGTFYAKEHVLNSRGHVNKCLLVIKYLLSTYYASGTLPGTEPWDSVTHRQSWANDERNTQNMFFCVLLMMLQSLKLPPWTPHPHPYSSLK